MATTERSGHTTTNHDFIRQWVEERGGWPARVIGTGDDGDAGLIRVDFPGFSGEGRLERIEWEEWFEKFEESDLAFLHRDMSHGGDDLDRFNKLVRRGDEGSGGSGGRSGGTSSRKSGGNSARASSSSSKSSGSKSSGSKGGGGSSRASSSGSKSSGSKSSGSKSGGSSSRASSSGSKSTAPKSSGSKSSGSKSSGAKSSGAKSGGAAREQAEAPNELRELLLHELGDLLFAERQFVVGTRTLAREAQNPEVKARLEEHVTETQGQVERLQAAFRSIGERPKAETCEAALGLKEEHDSFKSEEKPSKQLLSAFDLGSGLRVEHYEIAGYRSAIAVATALGERECAGLLKESLKEEIAMAAFLEKNSLAVLREMAGGGSGRARA
ncbi:MAG TPA: ferritin-like domain-containing protein [Longimicrobium sp.]|nr:ferritin-like domain-containing protein [Longimicrobium sp.]